MEQFTLKVTLPASPEAIFQAWLSTEGHSAMTGSPAEVEPGGTGAFKAWDGYIWGRTLETKQGERILQAWRTSEFPAGSPDSKVEILLRRVKGGTELTLTHSEIPDGQGQSYQQGWQDFYFKPMQAFFSK
jgi:activator of HSP90 ATPase